MRFDEHPTWRMLEKDKNYYKNLLIECPAFMIKEQEIVNVALAAIVKLQLKLEDRLCRES